MGGSTGRVRVTRRQLPSTLPSPPPPPRPRRTKSHGDGDGRVGLRAPDGPLAVTSGLHRKWTVRAASSQGRGSDLLCEWRGIRWDQLKQTTSDERKDQGWAHTGRLQRSPGAKYRERTEAHPWTRAQPDRSVITRGGHFATSLTG